MRDVQQATAPGFRPPVCACLRDVAQRVRAFIRSLVGPVLRRIRRMADADGIENENEGAGQGPRAFGGL